MIKSLTHEKRPQNIIENKQVTTSQKWETHVLYSLNHEIIMKRRKGHGLVTNCPKFVLQTNELSTPKKRQPMSRIASRVTTWCKEKKQ